MFNARKRIQDRIERNPYLLRLFPKLKEQRRQSFAMLVFTLIAISGFGFFAINPTIATIVNLRKQVSDNQFVQNQLQEKISNLSLLQVQYATIQDFLPLVFQAIPKSPTIPIFVGKIQALAANNNVNIDSLRTSSVEISTEKTKDAKQFISFAFSLQADGGNTAITNFLTSLANFDRIISLDSISLTENAEKNNSLQLNIEGQAYFQPI